MRKLTWILLGLLAAALADAEPLRLDGDGVQAMAIERSLLDTLPVSSIDALDHGVRGHWRGVSVVELLRLAGAPLGDKMRGKALAQVVLVHAADGYVAAFTLSEFDEAFADSAPLLAWERDGKPLDAKEGPYRIIVAGEQRQGRWVRQVQRIEVRQLP